MRGGSDVACIQWCVPTSAFCIRPSAGIREARRYARSDSEHSDYRLHSRGAKYHTRVGGGEVRLRCSVINLFGANNVGLHKRYSGALVNTEKTGDDIDLFHGTSSDTS